MAQYNVLNVKLFNLQCNKLKSAIKHETEVTLNLSSNVVRDSNNEKDFLHKLLQWNLLIADIPNSGDVLNSGENV